MGIYLRPLKSAVALLAIIWITTSPLAIGQNLPAGDVLEDYARYLQLTGQLEKFSFGVRPLPVQNYYGRLDQAEPHPWHSYTMELQRASRRTMFALDAADPEVRLFWNSTRPFGQNDAAVWQGRGATLALSAGAHFKAGPLSAALRPVAMYTQNSSFERWSPTSYQLPVYSSIDLPEQFGPDPFAALDLGQSYIRLDYLGLAVGLSNENMVWGPAVYNPIVMSSNAPGFRHAFVGTSGPRGIGVGQLQTRWIWGELNESDYFDEDPDNDKRLITGIVVDFSPHLIPGLSLGLTRVFTFYPPDTLTSDDYLLVFQGLLKKSTTQDNGRDRRDQMLSAYLRWVVPESGLEIYGELARGDHSEDLRDFFLEFEHGTGYTLGLQKAFAGPWGKSMRFSAELTHLQSPKAALIRSSPLTGSYFYVHSEIRQGYTQRGQVLGAGIGPGANSQIVALDLFEPWGRAGLYFQRTTSNIDYFYYTQRPIVDSEDELEVELATGLHAYLFLGKYELGASLAFSRLFNLHNIHKNDTSNLNATLSLRRSLMGYR